VKSGQLRESLDASHRYLGKNIAAGAASAHVIAPMRSNHQIAYE
jgi:hypothetical protein